MTPANDGWVLADKPSGMGSSPLVSALRRELKGAKTGHCGTLDRFATGLMLLFTGRATTLSTEFLHQKKRYTADFLFGRYTDTHDPEGEVLEEKSAEETSEFLRDNEISVRQSLLDFKYASSQTPPAYSALKIAGRRYSDLARSGSVILPAERAIEVYRFDILSVDRDRGIICADIEVSGGTYIRSFARDLSVKLKYPVMLGALRRTALGPFSLESGPVWRPGIVPVVRSLLDLGFPSIEIDPAEATGISVGRMPDLKATPEGLFFIKSQDRILALLSGSAGSCVFRRVFV